MHAHTVRDNVTLQADEQRETGEYYYVDEILHL